MYYYTDKIYCWVHKIMSLPATIKRIIQAQQWIAWVFKLYLQIQCSIFINLDNINHEFVANGVEENSKLSSVSS